MVLAVAAVGAVGAASLWGIIAARTSALEQARRVLELRTTGRVREIERLLASTRGDILFLSGSTLQETLGPGGRRGPDPAAQQLAKTSLLLFLRAHPEVAHLIVRTGNGLPLVEAGRRGGVPLLWSASEGGFLAGVRSDGWSWTAPTLTTSLGPPSAGALEGPDVIQIEAHLDPSALLVQSRTAEEAPCVCVLRDASGEVLAREASNALAGVARGGSSASTSGRWLQAQGSIHVSGWSSASPWILTCAEPERQALALLQPGARRYRLALALNLAVMALAVLLGLLAVTQIRRRERVEAQAREDARVREVERQLFHAERLATVGRLAAGMAHEVNNPLEGLANYLALMGEAFQRHDLVAGQRHLDRAREGLDRAAGIVRRILSHADPDAAPGMSIDLHDAVGSTLGFIRGRPEFSAISFHWDRQPDPLPVRGSLVLLGQVFLNLMLNACEAQPGGGELRVRTYRDGADAVAEVADRGPGIDAETAARIFDPFFSTKQSTGLGLSTCDAITRQLGGSLSAATRDGGGAAFTVRLPTTEEEDA